MLQPRRFRHVIISKFAPGTGSVSTCQGIVHLPVSHDYTFAFLVQPDSPFDFIIGTNITNALGAFCVSERTITFTEPVPPLVLHRVNSYEHNTSAAACVLHIFARSSADSPSTRSSITPGPSAELTSCTSNGSVVCRCPPSPSTIAGPVITQLWPRTTPAPTRVSHTPSSTVPSSLPAVSTGFPAVDHCKTGPPSIGHHAADPRVIGPPSISHHAADPRDRTSYNRQCYWY